MVVLMPHASVPLLPAIQVAGELFPVAEHVEIEVIPRALRLIVP